MQRRCHREADVEKIVPSTVGLCFSITDTGTFFSSSVCDIFVQQSFMEVRGLFGNKKVRSTISSKSILQNRSCTPCGGGGDGFGMRDPEKRSRSRDDAKFRSSDASSV